MFSNQQSAYMVDIVDIDLNDAEVGSEDRRFKPIQEFLIQLNDQGFTVTKINHKILVRNPFCQVEGEPWDAELASMFVTLSKK